MSIRLITPPPVLPLTLAETKLHLRVDNTDEDSLITGYIEAATAFCDGEYGFLGRALVTQTWELILDAFPTHEIKVPLPPLQTVDSVKYFDPQGSEQVVATNGYWVDSASEPAWIAPAVGGWPTNVLAAVNAITVRFTAGFAPTTDSPPDLTANIPRSIKQALLLQVGQFYAQREDISIGLMANKLSFGAEQLLRPWRVVVPFA